MKIELLKSVHSSQFTIHKEEAGFASYCTRLSDADTEILLMLKFSASQMLADTRGLQGLAKPASPQRCNKLGPLQ
jgi:hypothetical protein